MMTGAEKLAAKLCGANIFDIKGVKDVEYPIELNTFIIVTDSGQKYLVEVREYLDDK